MPQNYEKASQKLTFKQIILNNFIGGIAWGLGATIGLSIVITLLGLLAKNLDLVPVIGTFASEVVDFVLHHNNNLQN